MTDDHHTPIPGERGHIATARSLDNNPLFKRGSVMLAVVAFIGFAVWSMRQQPQVAIEQPAAGVIRQNTEFEPARKEPASIVPLLPEVALPTPAVSTPEVPAIDELLEAARRAPVMAFGGGQRGANATASNGTGAASDPNFVAIDGLLGAGGHGSNNDQFDRMLHPTVLEGSIAGHLGNRNFVIAMGTSVPCVLETALSSDQPGFTSCVVTRDVLSDNGRVVLMEKGTQVVGEYRGGLRRGQNRLFVLWSRAKTPAGVIITLSSPATDAIGRSGFDGHVNTHWWERFGSAVLLSVVGDATSWVGHELRGNGVHAQGTASAGRDAAAIAVEQSIDISPTLTKHQGALVSIFVARDLDFSNIYRLQVTETPNTISDRAVLGDFYPRFEPFAK